MEKNPQNTFQIPDYHRAKEVRAPFEKPKKAKKLISKTPENFENKNIFTDLLEKSQELTEARAEAAKFLRGTR
ncbi:MAG: hypothetical protein Q4A27_00670 [bacterium]|nr:hypothetical protein [bacterium]